MTKKAVLVTGARNFNLKPEMEFRIRKYLPGTVFIHGDADGADTLCHVIVQSDGHYGQSDGHTSDGSVRLVARHVTHLCSMSSEV